MESYKTFRSVYAGNILPLYAYLVQTGLSIEQCDVTVNDVPFNDVAYTKAIRNSCPVTKLQVLLEAIAPRSHVVRAWMDIAPIPHRLLQPVDVVPGNAFGVCENLRDTLWHGDLVDPEVRVGGNDGTA